MASACPCGPSRPASHVRVWRGVCVHPPIAALLPTITSSPCARGAAPSPHHQAAADRQVLSPPLLAAAAALQLRDSRATGKTVFLAGTHDFAFGCYLGVWTRPLSWDLCSHASPLKLSRFCVLDRTGCIELPGLPDPDATK